MGCVNCGEIIVATIKVKDNNPVAAIQELLASMLDRQLVSAVLVPQEIPSGKNVVQTLVQDSALLKTANPLAPVFSVNSARIVAQMCVDQMTKAPSAWNGAQSEQEQAEQAEAPERPAIWAIHIFATIRAEFTPKTGANGFTVSSLAGSRTSV